MGRGREGWGEGGRDGEREGGMVRGRNNMWFKGNKLNPVVPKFIVL